MHAVEQKNTDREWRVLEIDDEAQPGHTHIIGVEIERSVWRSSSLSGGKIALSAYGLAGKVGDVNGQHGRLLGMFGGRFELNPDPVASLYTLTGGSMVVSDDMRGCASAPTCRTKSCGGPKLKRR